MRNNFRYQKAWDTNSTYSKEDAVTLLERVGFRNLNLCNGGDDDMLIVDFKRREFGFWEYGFSPFSNHQIHWPTDKNLIYYHQHSS